MTQRRRAKRTLDPGLPVYARRPVRTHGLVFGVRDAIPWRNLGISFRTILCWWRTRLISHDPRGDNAKVVREGMTDSDGNRLNGPTIEEWVETGYLPEQYPPAGWAAVPSPALEQYKELDGLGPWDHEMLDERRATQEVYDLPHRVRDIMDTRAQPTVFEAAVVDSPEVVEASEEIPEPVVTPRKGKRKT